MLYNQSVNQFITLKFTVIHRLRSLQPCLFLRQKFSFQTCEIYIV